MKTTVLIFALMVCGQIGFSQPPSGKAKKGDYYGRKVDRAGAISIAALPGMLEKNDTVGVKVKGKVLDVCSAKGCWMTMRVNDSTDAFVKMKDYAFFVPEDLKGKTVILEGISFVKTTSVDELKHYAEDAGKSEKEINAITKPEKQIRLLASGIMVAK